MAQVKKRRAPPLADYTRQADTMHIVVDGADTSGDVDLLRIAGKPKFAPQKLVLFNRSVDTDSTIVVTPDKGVDLTVVVPFGKTLEIPHPIKTIVDSGSSGGTTDIYCYWWDASTLDWNPEA